MVRCSALTLLGTALAACASIDAPQSREFVAASSHHNLVRAAYDDAGRADIMRKALNLPDAGNVALELASFKRAEIAEEATPAIARHEADFAHAASGKLDNITGGTSSGRQTIIKTQAANQAGWSDNGDEFVHAYSGMICAKSLGVDMIGSDGSNTQIPTNLTQIHVFDNVGNDTACSYANEEQGVVLTFYASKWPDVTLDQHFGSSLSSIVSQLPVKSEATVMIAQTEITAGSSVEGDTKAGAFLLTPVDGVTFKTALWVNKTGDWHVKERATFPVARNNQAPEFSSIELIAALYYALKLVEVDDHINQAKSVDVSY